MLDHYVYGKVNRISPEAPVPVVLKSEEKFYLGGAGNVFSNVKSLGSSPDILSVIGEDRSSEILIDILKDSSDLSLIIRSKERKTTTKTRIISGSHQMIRIDDETINPISNDLEKKLISVFDRVCHLYSGILLEDYNKGILTPGVIKHVIKKCKELEIPVIVDPKKNNIEFYKEASIIKPNFSEFCNLVQKNIDPLDLESVEKHASDFREKMCIDSLVVTMAERGIYFSGKEKSFLSPGYNLKVSDVSGAGDTVLALLSIGHIGNLDPEIYIRLCNMAGSIACSKIGAVAVTLDEIESHPNFSK